MTRSLPWLVENATKAIHPNDSLRSSRKRPSSPSRDASGSDRNRRRLRHRNLSSSPPLSPPRQELMLEGFNNDDGWMMVEDEFLATAQQFTEHLHHAEYQRLKRLVRSQNASVIQNIERPVDARTAASMGTTKQVQARHLRRDQILAGKSKAQYGEGDEKNDPWAFNPHLFSLMRDKSSVPRINRLATITPISADTNDIGLVGTSQNYSEQGSTQDILHKAASRRTKPSSHFSTGPSAKSPSARTEEVERGPTDSLPMNKHFAPTLLGASRSENTRTGMSSRNAAKKDPVSTGSDPSKGLATANAQCSPTAVKKHASQKIANRSKDAKEALRLDEVPTFLF